jgi:hypothetical protein
MVCHGYVNTNFEVQMIPQFMHVNQIAAKDTAIAEKDVTIAKQKDTLAAQELTIKRLTTENDALKAAHELEVDKLKQKDGLTTQELMIRRLNADIEAQKAAYEEEIETLRQRWEKEANQCSKCQKEGHGECVYFARKRSSGCWSAVKLER